MNGKRPSILLKGRQLKVHTHYQLEVVLNCRCLQIIKGIVYDQKQQPSVGAALKLTEISNKNHAKSILGYCFTDAKGEYLFAIEALPWMRYEITVYAPLL
jgi:hypothetical protein